MSDLSQRITKGTTPSKTNIKKDDVNFIKIENINKNNNLNFDNIQKISFECHEKELSRSILSEDDLLFSIAGALGRTLIVSKEMLPANTNQALSIIRLNDKSNVKFVNYLLNLKGIRKYIYQNVTVGAQPNLSLEQVNKIKLKFPSDIEQKKIVSFLENIDRKISFMEKKHTLYQSIKKYFLENLFPHDSKIPYLRLPMFSDEFKRFTLNELFISKKGKGLSKDKIQEDGENKCILYGELYTTYSQIISTIKSRTNIFEGVLSNKMDILMPCSTTTTGKDLATASALLKENVLLGGDITILRKKKDILDEIYFAYYLSFCLNKTLTSLAQGSTIIHLYWNHIKNIEVLIPSKEEQIQIAKIIKLLDDKIEQSSLQINNLKEYKKGLLQKMFI